MEDEPDGEQTTSARWEGLLPRECEEMFRQLSEDIYNHYMPYDQQESLLVGKLVESRWFLGRRKGAYSRLERGLYAAQPDPAKWSEEDWQRLSLASECLADAEKAVTDAFSRVDAMMQRRIDHERFEFHRLSAMDHFELEVKKFKFELWKAGLATFQTNPPEEEEEKPASKKTKAN
jgi:hypothetical protein